MIELALYLVFTFQPIEPAPLASPKPEDCVIIDIPTQPKVAFDLDVTT